MEVIDLHIHSNLSDGNNSPEEIVKLSIENGCKKISITDHEIVSDYTALEEKYGIIITPGIEFNTAVRNMHILGYGMKDITLVNNEMRRLRLMNECVCIEVIQMMKKDGYDISVEKVIEYLEQTRIDCEIIDKRKIVKYLIYKKYAISVINAYDTLIGADQKYYVPNKKLMPNEVIDLVIQAGGITVLAHPNTLNLSDRDLLYKIEELRKQGLSGIEIINGKMKLNNSSDLQDIARELDLIKTTGSDFHDPNVDSLGINTEDGIYDSFNNQIKLTKSI